MNTTVLYSIDDIYFTQLFVKANLFTNNFKYFYSKDSIVNEENIFIFDLYFLQIVKEFKRYISQINFKHVIKMSMKFCPGPEV